MITDQNGSQYRRNGRALRLTKEPVYVTQDDLFDSIVHVDLQNENAETRPEPRRSSRLRTVPILYKEYIMGT